jgi:hypothetical protein
MMNVCKLNGTVPSGIDKGATAQISAVIIAVKLKLRNCVFAMLPSICLGKRRVSLAPAADW